MENRSRQYIDEIRERLENIIEATNVGTWEWEIDTKRLIINHRYAEILGYRLEELEPFDTDKWESFAHVEDADKAEIILSKHFKGEIDFFDCEIRVMTKDGSLIWIRNKGKIIKWDEKNKPIRMFGTISDETANKKSQEKLLKLGTAIEQATVTILMTDKKGVIEYANPAFEKISGYTREEAIGKTPNFFKSGCIGDEIYKDLWGTITKGETWEGELINKRKDGNLYYEEARITPVIDHMNNIVNYLAIKQDITDRKILEQKLIEISTIDELTRVFNRRYVFESLEELLKLYERKEDTLALAILDIDFFKKINDNYGHPAGDYILKEFVKTIKGKLRKSDIVGRYGGEEFIIILPDASKEQAKEVIESILNECRQKVYKYDKHEIRFTFSAGISDTKGEISTDYSIEKLLKFADKRLYKAKNTGRNKIVIE